MEDTLSICPACHQPTMPEWYFCSNCGKELQSKSIEISAASQIGVYMLSVLLPPLGLWPGIKYLTKNGQKSKMVGIIAIVLTIISSIITTRLIFYYLQSYLDVYSGLINPVVF